MKYSQKGLIMIYNKIFIILLFTMALFGCSTTPIPNPEPDNGSLNSINELNGPNEADTYGAPSNQLSGGEYINNSAKPLANVIYFDFDSAVINDEDQSLILEHANKIKQNSLNRVRLEGHTDELGSREYNIGLGESRAQSVRQMLIIHGVDSIQILTVSFGEERPEAIGRTEVDYAKNRRTEIKYIN
ncbi:MAG: peptidoglycan-associated lipoprotein [Woeseia sp.]|nr:peptidoglycan-associated lipoprotein [Woeseia sp.]